MSTSPWYLSFGGHLICPLPCMLLTTPALLGECGPGLRLGHVAMPFHCDHVTARPYYVRVLLYHPK